MVGMSFVALYFSCTVLQDTVNINRLFHFVTNDEDLPESTYEVDSYLVWSPKCQIPNLNPFDESIRKFITHAEPIVCSTKPALTYTTIVPEGTLQPVLKMNISAVPHYTVHPEDISCCYSVISRVNTQAGRNYNDAADNYYSISKCSYFEREVVLNPEEEFILVRCFEVSERGAKTEVYKNTHAVVQVKRDVQSKFNKSNSEKSSTEENKRLNVLLLGFDSMSRLNLLRTMPKTVQYLRHNGWLELLGYNKVGDNTLPNVAAILTGLNLDQMKKQCWTSRFKKFDDCPFVWKEFSKLGYVTVYAEDQPTGSTFNYHKTGFVIPPTDYYIRPFLLASEHELPVKIRDFMNVCLGPTPTSEHIFRYTTDFMTVFKSALYFMIAWINNFSHSSNATPETMDERVAQFFHELEKTGALNTTFVIFLSDHGMRWGDIRSTAIGWFEERLPFIYIWVPEWFKQTHSDLYTNLQRNINRLTSPFDLYMTLKEILERSRQDNITCIPDECPGCPKCVSLFSEVSTDRACEDAGVPANWCTCNKYRSMPTKDKTSEVVALYVLSEINAKVKKLANSSSACAELTLRHVIKMKRKVPVTSHDDFVVVFDTLPGGAVFEATVGRSDGVFQLRGDVSRINSYGDQSSCVDDSELKLYCYCT